MPNPAWLTPFPVDASLTSDSYFRWRYEDFPAQFNAFPEDGRAVIQAFAFFWREWREQQRMRNQHTRLPIILILIVLLSASTWAVASASSRVSATWRSGIQVGHGRAFTVSGEPDQPGVHDGTNGGKASGGSSRRMIPGDLGESSSLAFWIRLLQARSFGL